MPTCNFYHFLVSFASQARPEDVHGATGVRETKGETTRSEGDGEESRGRRGGDAATRQTPPPPKHTHTHPNRELGRERRSGGGGVENPGRTPQPKLRKSTISHSEGPARVKDTTQSGPHTQPTPSTVPSPHPPVHPAYLQLPVGAEPESSND